MREFFKKNKEIFLIFKNAFWLIFAQGINSLLKLFLIIFGARILGPLQYGKFTFAMAFASLFVVFSNFGLHPILVREFAKDQKKEKYFPSLFTLKILLCLLCLFLILFFAFFVTKDPKIRELIFLFAFMVIFHTLGEFFFSFFRARQKMEYEAQVKIGEAILVTFLGFFVLFNFPSPFSLALAYLISSFFAFLAIFLFFKKKTSFSFFKISFPLWKKFLKMAWPLAFVGFFAMIYNQIDSVMLGYFGQIVQNGWYNAAWKILLVAIFPSLLLSQAFFPALSLAFKKSREKFSQILSFYLNFSFSLVLPLILIFVILAPKIINFFYPLEFKKAIFAFQILALNLAFIYLNLPLNKALIVAQKEKKVFLISLFGALLNFLLNFSLIPKYSLYGASFATLLSFFFMFLAFSILNLKFGFLSYFKRKFIFAFFPTLFSSFFLFLFLKILKFSQLHLFLIFFFCLLIYSFFYFFSLFCFKKIWKIKKLSF